MLVRISTILLVRNPFPSQPIVLIQTSSPEHEQVNSLDTTVKSVNNRSVQSKNRDYGTLQVVENHSTTSQQDQTATTDILDSSIITMAEEHDNINLPQDSPQDYTRINTDDILLTLSSSLIQEETNLLGIPPHLLIDQEPVISESSTPQESIDLCESPTQEEQTERQEEIIALDISTLPVIIPQEEEVQDIIIPAISQNEQVIIPIVAQKEQEEIFIPVIVQEPTTTTKEEKEPVTHVIPEIPIQEEQQETALSTISEEEQEPVVLIENVQEATTSHTAIKEEEEENTTLLNTSQITSEQEEPQKNEQDISPKSVQVPEVTLVELTDDNEKKNEADFIEISEVAPIKSFLLEKSMSAIHPTTLPLESDNKPVPRRLISKETMDDDSVNYYKSSRENIHANSPLPPRIENMTPSASTPNRKRYSLYAAIGTRIHPRSSLDDSKGMPVFQPPSPTVADKLKPKTILKRFKTIVKNNKKKSPTL
ncbi:hypothetical protein BD770DRAFT_385544 [Pilaira anomala]|nr:hypothetical protein BD770DRAFT_385544 [Pilaira anomala]